MADVFSAAFVEPLLINADRPRFSLWFDCDFITGVGDDMFGWDPRLKIAGQMMAAAALAVESVGVQVASGALSPLLGAGDTQLFFFPGVDWVLSSHVYSIVGTGLVAVMVLGGCNSANLIDGLDGLLSGVTGIALIGLTLIGMILLPEAGGDSVEAPQSLAVARIVLAVVGLGAILGFLPHNFNPANIFLGDAGVDVGLLGGVHHFDVGRPWSNPCGLGWFDGVYPADFGHIHGNCSPQTVRQA